MNDILACGAAWNRHVFPVALTALLSACGGDDSTPATTGDVIAPTWETATEIGVNDPIVIRFDESVDTASLALSGDLADLVAAESWTQTAAPNDTLTLTPSDGGWYSGSKALGLSVADTSGNAATATATLAIRLSFETFQAASVVIGQTDFTSSGGAAAADTLTTPSSDPMVIDGRLWIADTGNNRVLGYNGVPATNGASATWVIGQSTFTASGSGLSASQLYNPIDIAFDDGDFYISDFRNHRALIFDGVPLSPPATASHVVGQADLTSSAAGCDELHLLRPEAVVATAGKLIVADASRHRVLIWNTPPTSADNTPPDLVLGQADFLSCSANDDDQDGFQDEASTARTLARPYGVWSDGSKLIVADTDNERILIWNSFPTSNFQPADVVVGQSDFTHNTMNDDDQNGLRELYPTARTMYVPTRVWSNGLQLVATDRDNHRVLVWNTLPTENFQPADVVLGQSDFTHAARNDDDQDHSSDDVPSARTVFAPSGVGAWRNKLLISDRGNSRVLVFESQ